MSRILEDRHSRRFVYLRLSVTDRCNFSCQYCLPNGYQRSKDAELNSESELTLEEISNLVSGFAELGVRKVRLTGGEPTLRSDIVEIAERVKAVPGVEELGITTNGSRLRTLAKPLWNAGVRLLNLSLDSLDPSNFKAITGRDRLPELLEALEIAQSVGFQRIKINSVLLSSDTSTVGGTTHELERFLDWIRTNDFSVRFIELMHTIENGDYFSTRHRSGGWLQLELRKRGWSQKSRAMTDGPAVEFTHPEFRGRIGIIAPYSEKFCETCNRLRVSSKGGLRLCLFGDGDRSLRRFLQSPCQRLALQNEILSNIQEKKSSHYLKEGNYGSTSNFSIIGG